MAWYSTRHAVSYPGCKQFAFTIVDDTDNSTLATIRPLYDLLRRLGIRTTKTVWVYPSRDGFSGDTLQDSEYVEYLLDLQKCGFEIALHSVGSGRFVRSEIKAGIREFEAILGQGPTLHANHGWNPDCLYWGQRRFTFPAGWLFQKLKDRGQYSGEIESSQHFWGDTAQEQIQYVRNHTFRGINLDWNDPWQPYHDRNKPFVNFWFSAVSGRDIHEVLSVLTTENIDRLERERGVCILYTHAAYGLVTDGKVDSKLQKRLEYLASKDAFFVPVTQLLNHLRAERGGGDLGRRDILKLDFRWARDHARMALQRAAARISRSSGIPR